MQVWGAWFRGFVTDHFYVIVLLFGIFGSLGFLMHSIHHGAKEAEIQIVAGLVTGFSASFFTIMNTMAKSRSEASTATADAKGSMTVTKVSEETK